MNAVKLAEGEDLSNPHQGLPGLEAIWLGLQHNSDMYHEEAWLYDRDMDERVRDWLTGRAGNLGIQAPPDEQLKWGTELGKFVGLLEGAVFLATDGQALLNSLKLISKARALYNLDPIKATLETHLDVSKVAAWAAAGGKLRLGMVGLKRGR